MAALYASVTRCCRTDVSSPQELYKAALLTGLSTENGSAGKALKEVCVALMPKVRANATVRLLRVMESRCASSSDAAGSTCEGPSAMFRVPLSQTLAHVVAGRAHQWTTLGSNPHGGQASNLLRALFDQPFFWKASPDAFPLLALMDRLAARYLLRNQLAWRQLAVWF